MRHSRGINLAPANDDRSDDIFDAQELAWLSLEKMREWYVLGGKCSRCLRKGWLDRYEIQRRFGRSTYLEKLRPLLRCKRCQNKGDNTWIVGKMAR
jgi:hypothetical protein